MPAPLHALRVKTASALALLAPAVVFPIRDTQEGVRGKLNAQRWYCCREFSGAYVCFEVPARYFTKRRKGSAGAQKESVRLMASASTAFFAP